MNSLKWEKLFSNLNFGRLRLRFHLLGCPPRSRGITVGLKEWSSAALLWQLAKCYPLLTLPKPPLHLINAPLSVRLEAAEKSSQISNLLLALLCPRTIHISKEGRILAKKKRKGGKATTFSDDGLLGKEDKPLHFVR